MKPPMCKLCGKAHWTYEEHDTGLEEVRKLGASVLRKSVTKRTPVTKIKSREEAQVGTHTGAGNLGVAPPSESTVPSLLPRGRPRQHKTNAERQAAYRERSRG